MGYLFKESIFLTAIFLGLLILLCSLITLTARQVTILSEYIYKGMEVTKSMLVYAEPPSSTSTQFGQLLPLFAVTPTPTITSVQTLVQTIKSSHIPNNNFQADPSSDAVWERLSMCEAGGHWNEDTGNSFYGGLQFTLGTWASVGGVGKPSDASKDEQIYRAKILQSRRGWGPWPACSKKLGLE